MGLVRLDKIGADTHIVNIKLTEDVVRGNVVKVGSYAEYDAFAGSKPTALTDAVAFIGEQFIPTYVFDREETSVLKAGQFVRGYLLRVGEVVTVTKDLITGTPVKDQFVALQANNYGLKFSATVGGTESLVFVVDDVNEKLGGFDACVLRVVKGN